MWSLILARGGCQIGGQVNFLPANYEPRSSDKLKAINQRLITSRNAEGRVEYFYLRGQCFGGTRGIISLHVIFHIGGFANCNSIAKLTPKVGTAGPAFQILIPVCRRFPDLALRKMSRGDLNGQASEKSDEGEYPKHVCQTYLAWQ